MAKLTTEEKSVSTLQTRGIDEQTVGVVKVVSQSRQWGTVVTVVLRATEMFQENIEAAMRLNVLVLHCNIFHFLLEN